MKTAEEAAIHRAYNLDTVRQIVSRSPGLKTDVCGFCRLCAAGVCLVPEGPTGNGCETGFEINADTEVGVGELFTAAFNPQSRAA